jgi:hypothetical protein
MTDEERNAAFENHRRDQRRWIAEDSTPEQRLQWLEDMLQLLYRNGLLPNKMDKMGTWPEPGER